MTKNSRSIHPELLHIPAASPHARAHLERLARIWSLLRRRGEDLFTEQGWRTLGLGVVQVADPVFDALGLDAGAAWGTIDARDGWGQTVLDVARRQQDWRDPDSQRVIVSLSRAHADLWRVATATAPRIVLHRVRDDSRVTLHAALDEGAYPPGALLAARICRYDDLDVGLCSAVVSRSRAAELLRGDEPYPLVRLATERAAWAVDSARGALADPKWLVHGPRLMARAHHAAHALRQTASRLGSARHRDAEGRLVRVDALRGITVDVATGRRFRVAKVPPHDVSAVDLELAFQAGLDVRRTAILDVRPVFTDAPITRRELAALCDACAGAAIALGSTNLHRAAS